MGDFNAHSYYWNPLITSSNSEASYLEEIIDRYKLILNNEPGVITRPNLKNNRSIIDLTFTTPELGMLESWGIEEENSTPSDHELIFFNWSILEPKPNPIPKEITGWNIDQLNKDLEKLEKAKKEWSNLSIQRKIIDNLATKEEIENEAIWIEETLTKVLNLYAKPLRITAYSKRWWNNKVKDARLKYSQCRREYKNSLKNDFITQKLKAARNNYYYIVRKEKRECWQAFLQGEDDIEDNIGRESINRCWQALKYTSPRISSFTPPIKAPNGSIATTIEEKEAIFLESAFPRPISTPTSLESPIPLYREDEEDPIENIEIRDIDIENALFQ